MRWSRTVGRTEVSLVKAYQIESQYVKGQNISVSVTLAQWAQARDQCGSTGLFLTPNPLNNEGHTAVTQTAHLALNYSKGHGAVMHSSVNTAITSTHTHAHTHVNTYLKTVP